VNSDGRSAIVTGGAGGLGSATVRRLVAIGMHVVVFDRDKEKATALADELSGRATPVVGDVLEDGDVAAAIDAAAAAGTFSVVVNIAGGATGGGRIVSRDGAPADRKVFADTVEMNAVATFNVSRLAAAAMANNEPDDDGQRGVIVNTGSIAGMEGQAGQLAYAAGKAAVLGMTLPMARDLAPLGIRVCAIAPGTMGTPVMLGAPEDLQARLVKDIMFPRRMGRPEEYARLVESVVTNPYLNGENIRLDGALRFPPK
jgi:NAD(P)-dependent dehydrogenase (short-subunit alcohol dehydrogenase family)